MPLLYRTLKLLSAKFASPSPRRNVGAPPLSTVDGLQHCQCENIAKSNQINLLKIDSTVLGYQQYIQINEMKMKRNEFVVFSITLSLCLG